MLLAFSLNVVTWLQSNIKLMAGVKRSISPYQLLNDTTLAIRIITAWTTEKLSSLV